MREILFRGKRTHNDEWIVGSLHIEKFTDDEEYLCCEINQCDVYPETVGQYTGLCDKNGKKIFEGDILRGAARWLNEAKNGVVTFRDGAFGFIWLRGDVEMFHSFTSVCNVVYEVIGNITDNPELLKGNQL